MMPSYRFADYQLNPATRELRRAGEAVALPARALDCLAYLIAHRDRAVGRDELVAAIWGRAEVSDALLSHTVVTLRRSLGDSGHAQRTIRTVLRFGYRWVGEVEEVAAEAPAVETVAAAGTVEETAAGADGGAVASATGPEDADGSRPLPAASPWWRHGAVAPAAAALLVLALAIAAWAWRDREAAPAPVQVAAPAAGAASTAAPAMPALVLPAEVDAPGEWRWLRLGLMDLVANRLRDGRLPTMPSESVVALLKQRAEAGQPATPDGLAGVAALRVLPRARLEGGEWQVRLQATGMQRTLEVEARAAAPMPAMEAAADRLLAALGHAPGPAPFAGVPPAVQDLLQRSGAAMLADQLDAARALIDAAPPAVQQEPHVVQRLAQLDLRAGDYAAVQARLHALLDRLGSRGDPALRARALLTLAASFVREDRADEAADLYEEAIELRRGAADHPVLGVAWLGRGIVLAQQGHYDEAASELARARIELASVGDRLGVAGVEVNLGEFQLARHRAAEALPMLAEAAAGFEQLGAREGLAHALAQRARAEGELLEYAAALATTTRFWPPSAHTSNQRLRWTLAAVRAQALADAAQAGEALAVVAEIRGGADAGRDIVARAQADLVAARVALQRGDAAAAAGFAAAARVPALRRADPVLHARAGVLLARALRADGRSNEALQVAAALRTQAAGDAWEGMLANLAEAEQAAADGDGGTARARFADALAAATASGTPEDLVAVAAPYAAQLVQDGDLETARTVAGRIARWSDRDARAARTQALLFRALGEEDAARQAEHALARLEAGARG